MVEDKPNARFEALCQAYLEDAILPEEAVELKQLLEANPSWVQQLLSDVKMACLVKETVRQTHEAEESSQDVIAEIAGASVRPLLPKKRRRPKAVRTRRPQRSMVFPAAVLMAACFVALVGVAMLVLSGIKPQVAETIARLEGGQGVWIERDGQLIGVVANEDLQSGDVVRTETGRAVIRYKNEVTVLSVFPHTRLSIADTEGGKKIDLASGKLMAEVAKQPEGHPMTLTSRHGAATVLGTRFVLDTNTQRMRLDVSEGRVRLHNGTRAVEVGAGYFAVASPTVALVATPLNPAVVAVQEPAAAQPAGRPQIVSFYLVDAISGQKIPSFDPLEEGAVIDLSKLPSKEINIVAVTEPRTVHYVRWTLSCDRHNVSKIPQAKEQFQPYSMAGDDFPYPEKKNGFKRWAPKPGQYKATATAYDGRNRSGSTRSLSFTIVDAP